MEEPFLKVLTHRLEQDIAEYDEQTKAKISAVQKKQAELLENFENDWRTRMPEQYRRPSKRLLELKTSAHELGATGHYEEAQLKHDEAVELEAAERLEAQRKLNRDYRFAKERILSQYKQELENLIESRRLKKELMETQKRQLEISEQKRETVLRAKFQNPPKKSQNKGGQSSAMQTARSMGPTRKSIQANEIKLPPLIPPNPLPQKAKTNQSVPSTKPSSRNENEIENSNEGNDNDYNNNSNNNNIINNNDNNNNNNTENAEDESLNNSHEVAALNNAINNTNIMNALTSLGENKENQEEVENEQNEKSEENNTNVNNDNQEPIDQNQQAFFSASGLIANTLGQKPSDE